MSSTFLTWLKQKNGLYIKSCSQLRVLFYFMETNSDMDNVKKVSTLQGQLLTIQGPLVEMVAADYRSTRLGLDGRERGVN